MNFIKYFLKIFLILLSVLSVNLFSQTKYFSIKGIILDQRNSPIYDVIIKLNINRSVTASDKNGAFVFENLNSGSYHIEFSHVSYKRKDTNIVIDNNTQLQIFLIDSIISSKNVVVTGTRTAKEIKSTPIPTEVISKEDIKQTGITRLDDILGEQIGMNLIEDHGKGVQIQGLDPTFALILLNSEPVIGTMTGKLNLERFALGNLKRLEIVKGPSSSIYGSNALAGVINLITEKPLYSKIGFNSKYSTFNTLDISIDGAYSNSDRNFGISFFGNRLSSDGYQLNYLNTKQKLADFKNYTLSNETYFNFSDNTELTLRARFNREDQTNQFGANSQDINSSLNDVGVLKDFNISSNLRQKFSVNSFLNIRLYGTSYSTETKFYSNTSDNLNTDFYQKLGKAEAQFDWILTSQNYLVSGIGFNLEQVESDIIAEKKRKSSSFYAFIQDDWNLFNELNLIGSIRFDNHSDYSSSLNPKFAFSWKAFSNINLKASIGSGFKAPTFEQLYLAWNNPTSGYSVYGVAYLKEGLQKLKENGQILDILIDPGTLGNLNPENSWSLNVGATFDLDDVFSANINFFRNNVKDLIDFLRVAIKTNGLSLYTYANFHRVHTQGIETQIIYKPFKSFSIELGYQYLDAIDDDVFEKIQNGQIWKRDIYGTDRPVKTSEYGGLFNRSKHTGIIKIKYSNEELGFSAFIRGNIRSKYGYADINGNAILDDEREYAPGYATWNFTASKELYNLFTLQAGIKNILDIKDERLLTRDPGRTYFISVMFNYIFDN